MPVVSCAVFAAVSSDETMVSFCFFEFGFCHSFRPFFVTPSTSSKKILLQNVDRHQWLFGICSVRLFVSLFFASLPTSNFKWTRMFLLGVPPSSWTCTNRRKWRMSSRAEVAAATVAAIIATISRNIIPFVLLLLPLSARCYLLKQIFAHIHFPSSE